ncbi:hypothetical protein ACFY7H_24725 [Streptomyces sp. NPDC012794]|uniref:hypothetical protein n=1 Tax=Streptomyces sp. NPDC012794 TaxID=3364850 RepID=UPI00367AEAB9
MTEEVHQTVPVAVKRSASDANRFTSENSMLPCPAPTSPRPNTRWTLHEEKPFVETEAVRTGPRDAASPHRSQQSPSRRSQGEPGVPGVRRTSSAAS